MRNKSSVRDSGKKHKTNKAAEKRMTKVEITLSPGLREYAEMKVRAGLYEDISDVVREALRAFHSGENSSKLIYAGEGEIEALAFNILMQVTEDMNEDLKMIMAEVKAMTAAKQKYRQHISKVSGDKQSDFFFEMMEMTSLRLQMMMERRSRIITTLSNIMKKLSATQENITRNIK